MRMETKSVKRIRTWDKICGEQWTIFYGRGAYSRCIQKSLDRLLEMDFFFLNSLDLVSHLGLCLSTFSVWNEIRRLEMYRRMVGLLTLGCK